MSVLFLVIKASKSIGSTMSGLFCNEIEREREGEMVFWLDSCFLANLCVPLVKAQRIYKYILLPPITKYLWLYSLPFSNSCNARPKEFIEFKHAINLWPFAYSHPMPPHELRGPWPHYIADVDVSVWFWYFGCCVWLRLQLVMMCSMPSTRRRGPSHWHKQIDFV